MDVAKEEMTCALIFWIISGTEKMITLFFAIVFEGLSDEDTFYAIMSKNDNDNNKLSLKSKVGGLQNKLIKFTATKRCNGSCLPCTRKI